MPGLHASERRQCFRLGHDPAKGAVFVQVAEHLDADGLVQAAHADRFVAVGADQVSDQVACGGGRALEAPTRRRRAVVVMVFP